MATVESKSRVKPNLTEETDQENESDYNQNDEQGSAWLPLPISNDVQINIVGVLMPGIYIYTYIFLHESSMHLEALKLHILHIKVI